MELFKLNLSAILKTSEDASEIDQLKFVMTKENTQYIHNDLNSFDIINFALNFSLIEEWLSAFINAVPTDDYLTELAESYFLDAFEHNSQVTAQDALNNLSMSIQCVPAHSKLLLQALANRADVLYSLKEYQV